MSETVTQSSNPKIAAAVQQALIAADPVYYSWNPEQQAHFRAAMPYECRLRAHQMLLKRLVNVTCDLEEVATAWNALEDADNALMNHANQYVIGVGENFIYLNEFLPEDKSLLDFTTVYDYDKYEHDIQQQANSEDFADYQAQEYIAICYSIWIRLIINDQLSYGTIESLAGYIAHKIENNGDELIGQLIPHEFIDGENHGNEVIGGFELDFRLEAHGLEQHLDELKERWIQYPQLLNRRLGTKFKDDQPMAFVVDTQNIDQHKTFIFNNANALKRVRWSSFYHNVTKIEQPLSTFSEILNAELNTAKAWIQAQYQDIMDNFDSTVVKLKKPHNALMSEQALDDLNRINKDDDPISS